MTHSGKLQSIFLHATHMTGQHGGKKLKGMEGRGERRVKQINLRKEKDCQKVQTFSLLFSCLMSVIVRCQKKKKQSIGYDKK